MRPNSEGDGASAFADDPQGSSQDQTIFWAPEVLPTVVPIRSQRVRLGDGAALAESVLHGRFRQASDGWHALLRIRGVEHRLWLKEPPRGSLTPPNCRSTRISRFARMPRAGSGAPQWARRRVPPFMNFPHNGASVWRWRCAHSMRAWTATSYRAIAEVLFGDKRIPERAWKTHDLRNRTIRLVQSGFALMRGGYRELLRPPRRKK